MEYYFRPNNIVAVQNYLNELGLDPEESLRMADIQPDEFGKPGLYIPSHKLFDLLHCAAVNSGRPSFGLEWGAKNNFRRMGALAAFIENCASVREAVDETAKILTVLNWGIKGKVVDAGATHRFELEIVPVGRFPRDQYVESLMVALLPVWHLMLGDGWRPQEVWFLHPRLGKESVYTEAFGCPVKFSQRSNAIVALPEDFDHRITPADTRVKRYVKTMIQEGEKCESVEFISRVNDVLRKLIPAREATLVSVARRLALPAATVQKKLAANNRSLKEMVTGLRIEILSNNSAQNGVTEEMQMELVGIHNPSAFKKFLKQHQQELAQASAQVGETRAS